MQQGWQSPAPGQLSPRPPRRPNPLATVLKTVLVFGALLFVGTIALGMLFPDNTPTAGGTTTSGPTTRPGATTAPPTTAPEAPYTAPPPDMNPSELPEPETYTEATRWLQQNAVYKESVAVPNPCGFLKPINASTASVVQLQAHIEDLTACLTKVWTDPVTSAGFELPRPPATVYTAPINTACGKLEKVNASYCGGDQRIYYSVQIPRIFPPNLRNSPFLMDLVLAHEFGHTIQARTGISISEIAWEQKVSTREANVYSRRLEQQADCLAGMFAQAVAQSQGMSEGDLATLQEISYNLGDDVLSGDATIDSGHGLGKNRRAWYTTGLGGNATVAQCNTFIASPSSVR